MGNCHCNLFKNKEKDKNEKRMSKQISAKYSRLKPKISQSATIDFSLTPGQETSEFVSVTSYDNINDPVDAARYEHDVENSISPRYEISVTGASYDTVNYEPGMGMKSDTNQEQALDLELNEPDMTSTELINDGSKLDPVNSFVPSEDQTPQGLGGVASLEPYGSNEAWDQPQDASTDNIELSEIQEEMHMMEKRLSYSAEPKAKTISPRPRRGSHLAQVASLEEWTQDDIEQSVSLMERQMSYLRQQLTNAEENGNDDPSPLEMGKERESVMLKDKERQNEDEDDSISDLEEATPRGDVEDEQGAEIDGQRKNA